MNSFPSLPLSFTFDDHTSTFHSPPLLSKKRPDLIRVNSSNSSSTLDTFSNPSPIHSPLVTDFEAGLNSPTFEIPNDENCTPKKAGKKTESKCNSTSGKKSSGSKTITDRFIPSRKVSKFSLALTGSHEMHENSNELKKRSDNEEEQNFHLKQLYQHLVLDYDTTKPSALKKSQFANTNILRYRDENNFQQGILEGTRNPLEDCEKIMAMYQTSTRKVAKTPIKVLDAPALQDDFYLNLLDWSSTNILSVGLSSCVYLWSGKTSKVTKLCDLGMEDTVTSIQWAPRGDLLCIGTNTGELQLWDTQKVKKVRTLEGHNGRVSSIAWNSDLIASGSRDQSILYRDIRTRSDFTAKLQAHRQEVCGLKWSFDGQQLASGGNDNKVYIWSPHSSNPISKYSDHQAAVKALAWSPHQHGLLATGGGTADKTIRFWNTLQNTQLDCIETGSQVCNLMFSKNSRELISTHGYSQNQINIWKYPSMEKVTTLTGHSFRVLYLAMSPDGQTIVTGAGDETLRFWQAFGPEKSEDKASDFKSKLIPSRFDFR